jgi:choline dehydrogenase
MFDSIFLTLPVHLSKPLQATALNVTAKKEVVLSAGTFGTPHLLLNSGIGEKAHLDSVGVPTIHNLPNVGKGMTDHPAAFLMWSMNATDTP